MAHIAMDGGELFSRCLGQATYVVKQVLPSHFANPTPDAEWDVGDLTAHMMTVLRHVPAIINEDEDELIDSMDAEESAAHEETTEDLSARWQALADRAEEAISEADLEETITYRGEEITIENYLLQIAGDMLIHSWDLGEAIGMPVRFDPPVAEAVIETTVIPNETTLPHHRLFDEPLTLPANADIQTRLLAIFGRSRSWRATT